AGEWLLIEWPRGTAEPTKDWLSTLPTTTPMVDLVRLAKLRWRIERDDQELKDELGLDQFEGRAWRGFHHHGALCIAAYAFLAAKRASPSPLSLWPSSEPLRFPKFSSSEALPVRLNAMCRPPLPRVRIARQRATATAALSLVWTDTG